MRLKSRGLGRKELIMDFREYEVIREGKEIVIVGTIRDPVTWDFSIRMCEDDISGMARLLLCKPVIGLLLRVFFGRKPNHHWTAERSEHLAQGKEFLIEAKQKAAERKITYEETKKKEALAAQEVAEASVVPEAQLPAGIGSLRTET